jgi:hypothetical protein
MAAAAAAAADLQTWTQRLQIPVIKESFLVG